MSGWLLPSYTSKLFRPRPFTSRFMPSMMVTGTSTKSTLTFMGLLPLSNAVSAATVWLAFGCWIRGWICTSSISLWAQAQGVTGARSRTEDSRAARLNILTIRNDVTWQRPCWRVRERILRQTTMACLVNRYANNGHPAETLIHKESHNSMRGQREEL